MPLYGNGFFSLSERVVSRPERGANVKAKKLPNNDFENPQQRLEFEQELEKFTGKISLKDGDARKNYSHITNYYSVLPKRVTRTPKEDRPVHRTYIEPNGERVDLVIHPALLLDKNGNHRKVYPKLIEDRVEDALGYIAAQGAIDREPEKKHIRVKFTINQIRNVIRDLWSVTYSHDQIKEALQVLSRSVIDMNVNTTLLSVELDVRRITGLIFAKPKMKGVLSDADDELCSCYLNEFFAFEIAIGNYKIHDLRWQGKMKRELTQELFKRLCSKFTQASDKKNDYTFDAKSFMENTSVGFYEKNPSKSWGMLNECLEELIETQVIISHEERIVCETGTGGRPSIITKIVKVVVTKKFITHMKTVHWAEKEVKKASKKKDERTETQYDFDDQFGF